MSTLYLRNVPEEVSERLAALAARAGMSVASAAVLALLNDGAARRSLARETAAVPDLADSEVAQALRAQVLVGRVAPGDAGVALARWARLGLRRFAGVGLLGRIWELRESLIGYDATYVALAEALGCELVTADARLARAPGRTCPIAVVSR